MTYRVFDRVFRLVVRSAIVAIAFGWLSGALAQPRIVVSIHPYYDLVQRIAGPDADVVRLLPPGASPHTFDPTPSIVADVERADLVILNGGMDEWVLDLVAAAGHAPSVLELLPLYAGLDELAPGEEHEDGAQHDDAHHDDDAHHGDEHHEEGSAAAADRAESEEAHEHGHEGVNPHIWLDPVLMERAVGAIAERLAELDPDQAERYARNAADVTQQLRALDTELQEIMAPVRGAAFIPFHDAWPYFAARYGLDLVLEIEPFPGREPGPRYLAEVVGAIEANGARAIFAEAQLGDRPARVIAAEAGVEVRMLDPVGGVEGRNTYEELLRYNARTIVDALAAP